MADDFNRRNVPWLKNYLTDRGIQISDQGRTKRKAELVELAEKACEMKLPRTDEGEEDSGDVIASKLQTKKGMIPHPENIRNWSYDFGNMPQFTFAGLYTYLVGSEEYTAENLKSFKSLQGYKLFLDGHVQDCAMHCVKEMACTLFRFKVLPTERSKTDDNKLTYNGFLIMEDSGNVKGGFCPCKGG